LCEFVARLFKRYDSAALIPAIRTCLKTAPLPKISINPDGRTIRNATNSPLMRSLVSTVNILDFIS
jgi:hypothetical protein